MSGWDFGSAKRSRLRLCPVRNCGCRRALKADLTPLGAEKAGNKDGSIPAWTGGYTTPIPGDKPGGRRGDPFKDEKPLYAITAANREP